MNREEWLTQAAVRIASELELEVGDFSISVGWPSKMGLSRVRRRLGECWKGEHSKDGVAQVYISPVLDDPIGTVAHELLHVELPEAKHGPAVAKRAKALGFEGKPTNTEPGPELMARLNAVVKELGEYPHAPLSPTDKEQKQSTRLKKAECPEHGYVVRVTRKWLDDMGPPLCPCKQAMVVEEEEEE